MTTTTMTKTNGYLGLKAKAALAAATALAAGTLMLGVLAQPAHASTFTVTNTNNSGAGSLRQAINNANANSGTDTINFNIGGSSSGVLNINLQSELPTVTGRTTINGYSQPGSSVNTRADAKAGTNANPRIVLNGSGAGVDADGLSITGSGTVVKGLRIRDFGGEGIRLDNVDEVKIEGNLITNNGAGSDRGGVAITGVLSDNNVIGGGLSAARNLISGNSGNGVTISDSDRNQVDNNVIGANALGNGALSNGGDGVAIADSSFNKILRNNIRSNSGDGVVVEKKTGFSDPDNNTISVNSIFGNQGEGIDLGGDGKTNNDSKDFDEGANELQNFPVLSSVTVQNGKTKIQGTLNSKPSKSFVVQFFSSPSGDEGQIFLGAKPVGTSSNGLASFTFESSQLVPAGQVVTATASESINAGNGTGASLTDTSEFSAPKTVAAQ
jgi:hypothetical protein